MNSARKIIAASLALAATALCAGARAESKAAIAGAGGATPGTAIVLRDQAVLRAAPRDSAQPQAGLWQGEALEIRGEHLDYLQVYDYRLERGGFVRNDQVRRITAGEQDAPELLSFMRLALGLPDAEALGIALAAAYFQAAPAAAVNGADGVEALDALGTLAERLAQRASSTAPRSKAEAAVLQGHLDVAAAYGVKFHSVVDDGRDGRMLTCYDGDAFRRVLAMRANPVQRADAALAVTRGGCDDSSLGVVERARLDEWRADMLEHIDTAALPAQLKARVLTRRAALWSAVAYARVRRGEPAVTAANSALNALGGIDRNELTERDLPAYNDAAIRVSASRWAAMPDNTGPDRGVHVLAMAGQPGETCLLLVDGRNDAANPLARRCTFGVAWTASARLNREGSALAVAVQPMEAWRELWVFRKHSGSWSVQVLPPAAGPGVGYVEFAGWVPGGNQVLLARESRVDGKYQRRFELLNIDTLAVRQQSDDPKQLALLRRWQDPSWKQLTLSIR
jgi:hypothetical protein